jgi:hypothetical protein
MDRSRPSRRPRWLEDPAATKSNPHCSVSWMKSITLYPPRETLWKEESKPVSPREPEGVSTHITIKCTHRFTIAAKRRNQVSFSTISLDR